LNDGAAGEPRGSFEGGSFGHPAAHAPDSRPAVRRIELLPNCSLTVPGAIFFFATVALASLTFAMYFVLQGFWPVLPFAGAELALLGWALWASMRRRHWTQTITITEDDVEIVTRGPEGERRFVFSRHWASVRLRGPHGWHPSRLLVESHGRTCEVGGFLTEEERRALHARLAELIGRPAESPHLRGEPSPARGPAVAGRFEDGMG
jgi:uncharacterized membrane protein